MTTRRGTLRPLWVAIRYLVAATLVLGIAYPLLILGIGQLALPAQANGSMIEQDGETIGSSLIGQSFADDHGNPIPGWFQSRPSAAGYDASASAGSNYGPNNPALVDAVTARRDAIAARYGVDPDRIPADALTTSGSGLDPQISPEYALLQVPKVAEERGLPESEVRALVDSMTQPRDLGFLGEPTVNVVQLNAALAKLGG